MAFQLSSEPEVDLFASLCTNQCQHYSTLENLLPLEALELNTQASIEVSDGLGISSYGISL